jgi:NAD(P)-dependent dehydrogenase (short-subunit alcohol dehydrogenase family)
VRSELIAGLVDRWSSYPNPDRTADDVLHEWDEQLPSRRLGQPSDIADAVLFLGSDRSEYIVGTILHVSGGGNLQ